MIDTDDFYPSFRPSIDCDVLNSVIVEENDEDMQSLNSSIATSNDFEKSRQIDARIELSPKILSNRPMFGTEAGVLEDSAMAHPNRDISVGGQDKFQQISQTNIQSSADKEILEIEKTQTTDQLITHSNPNNFASDEINADSRQANRKNKFSVSSRCVSVDDNVGKETDVDDDDDDEDDLENDDQDQSCSNLSELVQTGPPNETNKGLYHSTLVTTCVDDDSDTEEEAFENYDLKVPNESWTDFKSSHNRPAPVGCSSDSPSAASSETSSGPEKDHYDSLEDDTDSPLVSVSSMTPKGNPMGAQKVGVQSPSAGPSNMSSTNSVGHGKRSLPSIPQDHSLQQIRAYEILRQQWQKQYDESLENNQDQSCSNLSEFVQTGPNWSQSREVRPRCIEGQEISEKFKEPTLNNKRQLPKPPPLSPLVFNNDSGVASLEEKCSGSESLSAAAPTTVTQRQFDEKKRSSGNGNSSVVSPVAAAPSLGASPQQQNNFLWVGLDEESSVQRRPKNHGRLSTSSKKRHSAPPGSLDEFQNFSQILANPAKKSSVSGHGHVTSKKSLQSNKSGIYIFCF